MKRAQEKLLEKVERLESLLAAGGPAGPVDDEEGDQEAGGIEESLEAQEERAKAFVQAQIAALQTSFDSELVDKEWAAPRSPR